MSFIEIKRIINKLGYTCTLILLGAHSFPSYSSAAEKSLAPRIKDPWLCIESKNFTLYSQADEKIAQKTVKEFELLYRSLFFLTNKRITKSPVPICIYLFKNKKSFDPFRVADKNSPSSKSGYFLDRVDGNFIALDAGAPATTEVQGTFSHFFVSQNLANVPLWFDVGLAGYLTTLSSNDKEIKMGLPVADYLSALRFDSWMPFSQLLNIDRQSYVTLNKKNTNIFPAQSWALVHYLLHGRDGALRIKVGNYLDALAQGKSAQEPFSAVFAIEPHILDTELKNYIKQADLAYMTIAVKELIASDSMKTKFLPEEETLFHLGNLLAHLDKNHIGEAETYFKSALAINANFSLSTSGLGFTALLRDQRTEALNYFSKASEREPIRAWTFFQLGTCLMNTPAAKDSQVSTEDILKARAYFQKAIDLDDSFAESYVRYGATFFFDLPGSLHSGTVALEMALTRMPMREDVATQLLALYAMNSDSIRINYLLEEIIKPRWGIGGLSRAQQRLVKVEFTKAKKHYDDGEYGDAIRLFKHLLRFNPDETQRLQAETMLRNAQITRTQELVRQAVGRANAKEDEKAVALLTEALTLHGKPDDLASAKSLYLQVSKRFQLSLYSDAMMKMNDNKLVQAERLLQRAIELDANPEITKRAKSLLKTVQAAK